MAPPEKAEGAFRTISEVAAELGLPQHILRYWETRFSQLKPLQRAGNRRYYRPVDVALARRIHHLLSQEGYTVRGVQKLLAEGDNAAPAPVAMPTPSLAPTPQSDRIALLKAIRDELAQALAEDAQRSS